MKHLKFFALLFLVLSSVPASHAQNQAEFTSVGNITSATTSCTFVSNSACVILPLFNGDRSWSVITIAGTWSGTLQFIATNASVPFSSSISMTPVAGGSAVTNTTSNGQWSGQVAALGVIGVYASAFASGTAVVTITSSATPIVTSGGGGGSGTVSGQANGVVPLGTTATTITQQSHLDDGNTTAGTITSSEPVNVQGQLAATGGLVVNSDGVHLGSSSLTCNTTNPIGFPFTNSFGWLAPNAASCTSYWFQPTFSAGPSAACLPELAAVASSIVPFSCPTSAFTSQTDGATVTWAIASALVANASLTFTVHGGSRTLNITNPVNGGSYVIWLKQDATGGEGLTLGSGCTWKVSGGGSGAISPSTGAGAIDVLAFTYDGTNCYANFNKNFN